MIVDTSAVVAALMQEEDADRFVRALSRAGAHRMSAATFVELSLVMEGQHGAEAARQCDAFLRRFAVVIEPLSVEQAYLARQAFVDFGKGRHKAALNLGDCFSYALAKATGEPLLFKGNDFVLTDVKAAI